LGYDRGLLARDFKSHGKEEQSNWSEHDLKIRDIADEE
jgi:hypothetical protein